MFILNEDYLISGIKELEGSKSIKDPEIDLEICDVQNQTYYKDLIPYFVEMYKSPLTQHYGKKMYTCYLDLLKYFGEEAKDNPFYSKLCEYSKRVANVFLDLNTEDKNKLKSVYTASCFLKEIPYREKFIYVFSLKETGAYLLNHNTLDGNTLSDRIINFLQPLIENAVERILNKNKKWKKNEIEEYNKKVLGKDFILKIWNYLSYYFEIGFWLNDDEKDFSELSNFIFADVYTDFKDKPIKASTYHLNLSINNDKYIYEAPLICSICEATWIDIKKIIGENNNDVIPTINDGFMEEAWNKNPLSVLLAISLILTEFPARICWREEIEKDRNEKQYVNTLPFSELRLNFCETNPNPIEVKYNEVEFEKSELKYLHDKLDKIPIKQNLIDVLPEIFGPLVFNFENNYKKIIEYKSYSVYQKEIEKYNSKYTSFEKKLLKPFEDKESMLNDILSLLKSDFLKYSVDNMKMFEQLEKIEMFADKVLEKKALYDKIMKLLKTK